MEPAAWPIAVLPAWVLLIGAYILINNLRERAQTASLP
jgi:hypothetical protein